MLFIIYYSQPDVINNVFSLNTHSLVNYKLKFLTHYEGGHE